MSDDFEMPEKAESRRERVVGLIIAAIAVVLAIVSSLGHDTHNQEILAHIDAADQYSYYQSKKDRAFALGLNANQIVLSRDRLSPASQAQADQIVSGYKSDQLRLGNEGKDVQAKGKELMETAERLAHKARVLDVGEIALQISIVLCSITILTEQRLFALMGVSTAGIGIVVALWGILMN